MTPVINSRSFSFGIGLPAGFHAEPVEVHSLDGYENPVHAKSARTCGVRRNIKFKQTP